MKAILRADFLLDCKVGMFKVETIRLSYTALVLGVLVDSEWRALKISDEDTTGIIRYCSWSSKLLAKANFKIDVLKFYFFRSLTSSLNWLQKKGLIISRKDQEKHYPRYIISNK